MRMENDSKAREVPWVEKYRPTSLDDVVAHKEIVDTSKRCLHFVLWSARKAG